MNQKSDETRYIPALSFRWLTPLYDPILKWVMREETFKRKKEAQYFVTIFGPLSLWRAVKENK